MKAWLRNWVLTPREKVLIAHGRILSTDELTLISASRATVLRSMLSPEAWHLLQAIEKPLRSAPEVLFTKEEMEGWEALIKAPIGLKIDAAMIGWLQQQAQNAIAAPSAEILSFAKFALGCRAGWEMAKSISRLAAAKSSELEDDTANGAAAHLAQHQP